MSKFDDFMAIYQDIDLIDIQSSIFEVLSEMGIPADSDDTDGIVTGLFARGYVVVPVKEVRNG
ncbi:hypothetical protein GCM10011514_06210 [Emticicia aquatilis]|uniref:Uncharacterized protein n=1 Tax=Emticicia aquatilis TaxID=1537369 RepID=A0A916YGX7_9BACT|nr:hypothetical protein [Emticicia aquatilis]GGD44947.1 hypothetical protein GCM10011514_06210 [Emticicia aquatilis]